MSAKQIRLDEEPTLGDFIKHIAARVTEDSKFFPYDNEMPWHRMLLSLKKEYGSELDFLYTAKFELDEAPYPTCRKLSDFLQTLHWSGALSVKNPSYLEAAVIPELVNKWGAEVDSQKEIYKEAIEGGVKKLKDLISKESK